MIETTSENTTRDGTRIMPRAGSISFTMKQGHNSKSIPAALGISGFNPISSRDRKVIKRDGRSEPFELSKITKSVALAFFEVRNDGKPCPYPDDPMAAYGLGSDDFEHVGKIAARVSAALELYYRGGKHPTVDQILNSVEQQIAAAGYFEIARAFIVYRTLHAARRLTKYEYTGLKDYIAASKYCRYRADLGRREVFSETVQRVREMHQTYFISKLEKLFPAELPADVVALSGAQSDLLKRYICGKSLDTVISEAFRSVERLEVLPSMRSLQFGGTAILKNHARMFNCAASPADRLEFFGEYFFLLLSGTGCGFSVQKHHVSKLPSLPLRGKELDLAVEHHQVADTIEGWARSLDLLVQSYYNGTSIEFNFSMIRPRGSKLKTSGGTAPGHKPLKEALIQVENILRSAVGRQLAPIEVYDICMFVARAVLSGGIRRSATICLFSPDDTEMMRAKTGDWVSKNSQRTASNNSAVIPRGMQDPAIFKQLFEAQKGFGEPGFFFCDDPNGLPNPCCEIGLHPVTNFPLTAQETKLIEDAGVELKRDLFNPEMMTGWQMCNLTTINGAICEEETTFYRACIVAAFIGTLQAAYSKIPFVGPVTQILNERDALLGVSICGMMDNPDVFFREEILRQGARLVRATNAMVADLIGINRAARLTCVKPEGTASLLLGAGSGIHPHHARNYFRRVQASRKDPVYQYFRSVNSQMVEPSRYRPESDDVVTFPVSAHRSAILRDQINAVDFLKLVRLVQQNWVLAGADPNHRSPGVNHNVSNTCTVKPDEWDQVSAFIWENREYFTGISLFAYENDKMIDQAPRESVSTEEDISKWNRLAPKPVDFALMMEATDTTQHKEIVACAGGSCSDAV